PLHGGLAVETATGAAFPAFFDGSCSVARGPEPVLRSARVWAACDSGGDSFVDSAAGVVTVLPFSINLPMSVVDWLLGLPDDATLLRHASTSPAVEHPGFAAECRASLRFLRERQGRRWAEEVFPGRRPLRFRLEGGSAGLALPAV
ncbi:unnamed protein product, partial [Phaeothamnion confervicola]